MYTQDFWQWTYSYTQWTEPKILSDMHDFKGKGWSAGQMFSSCKLSFHSFVPLPSGLIKPDMSPILRGPTGSIPTPGSQDILVSMLTSIPPCMSLYIVMDPYPVGSAGAFSSKVPLIRVRQHGVFPFHLLWTLRRQVETICDRRAI